MYTALRALMFGEDFTSDPVSRVLGYVLRYFSHGHLAINVQLVSQVRGSGLFTDSACGSSTCLADLLKSSSVYIISCVKRVTPMACTQPSGFRTIGICSYGFSSGITLQVVRILRIISLWICRPARQETVWKPGHARVE